MILPSSADSETCPLTKGPLLLRGSLCSVAVKGEVPYQGVLCTSPPRPQPLKPASPSLPSPCSFQSPDISNSPEKLFISLVSAEEITIVLVLS